MVRKSQKLKMWVVLFRNSGTISNIGKRRGIVWDEF
jgi:hypothetical protein